MFLTGTDLPALPPGHSDHAAATASAEHQSAEEKRLDRPFPRRGVAGLKAVLNGREVRSYAAKYIRDFR